MKEVKRIWNALAQKMYQFTARPEDKTVMKLKHWQEVNKDGKLHKQVKFPLVGQVKKDGVYALVYVTTCEVFIFNRTGREMVNVDCIKRDMNQALLPCGIYIGELCNEFCSLEVLSGIVNPNRTKELTDEQAELAQNHRLWLHDQLTVEEFISGQSTSNYLQRHALLAGSVMRCPLLRCHLLTVTMLLNEFEVESYAQSCIDAGEEGAVFKPATIWEAGHKGWRMMKWVREISYDLRCVGIEEGTGKYTGKVANLIFKWEGDQLIKAMLGKGWTHDDATRLYWAFCGNLSDTPVGKVYRVRGLSDSSKGKIRLPKVMEERHDKTVGDF
ncbi:DNA ligase [Pseudomonas phage Njord]|uniref:DNA ligase n=1 Tax=Pseudomonas phage Njord TaxID=2163985 RepID=A0A2S1GMJ7_9CAUD|nr:DNA ligase [Pseudomonas phage Njord]AWD90612.1 DNA ligase [Pseudomonas phage Njord]